MTKWLLHIAFSVTVFWVCSQGVNWVSEGLFTAGLRGLDVVLSGALWVLSGVFAVFFGGWASRRVIRWDKEHGYL